MKVKYVIKYLVPTVAAMMVAHSCGKSEPDQKQPQTQPQPQPQPQPTPHHNTTYVWGDNNWDAVWPATNIAKSADSTLVDNVFLQNDGKNMNGMLARDIFTRINNIIESVPASNRSKVRGSGTLNGVGIADVNDVHDSTQLSKIGFNFANTKHPHITTYIWNHDNWNAIWPADKVAASADSALVANVLLKNDGTPMNGMLVRDIYTQINNIIESVPAPNRSKVRGSGTLNNAGVLADPDVQDSIKLSNLGFDFTNTKHQHNTAYVWGNGYWDAVWPADNVAKSADSVWVKIVLLQNNGTPMNGMLAREIFTRINDIIESVPASNRSKVRGSGTLNGVGIADFNDVNDSIKLSNLGFNFANAKHRHNTTYVWGVDNWNAIWPADKVAASADSALVANVFLKNDGVNMNGMLARDVYDQLNKVIESVSSANRAKVHGYGILNGTGIMDEADVQDSTKLSKLGFYFANTKHQHNTTYIWGNHNWDAVWPADNVAKSADSTWVKNVILENDGTSFEGASPTYILNNLNVIIESVDPDNRHKICGRGTLNEVGMSEKLRSDSIKLVQMGFKFGRVR